MTCKAFNAKVPSTNNDANTFERQGSQHEWRCERGAPRRPRDTNIMDFRWMFDGFC